MARLALADFQLEGFVAGLDGGVLRQLQMIEVLAQAGFISILKPERKDADLVLSLPGKIQRE